MVAGSGLSPVRSVAVNYAMMPLVLVRLAYLGVTNVFALLRLLPLSDHDKDAEILVLRHQLSVLQCQLGDQRIRFQPIDRALLAALLHPLPRPALRRLRLPVHRTRSCDGTVIYSPAAMPPSPDRRCRVGGGQDRRRPDP